MNKLMPFSLLILLSLVVVSLSYALWSDNVYMNVTAATGDIEVKVTYAWLKSPFPSNPVTVTWTDDAANFAVGGYIYPGFTLHTGTDIKNVGSLPAKIEAVVYSYQPQIIEGCFTITNEFAFSPDGNTWAMTTLPVTLHPGQYLRVQQLIEFNCQELNNEAQGLSITITATITAVQALP